MATTTPLPNNNGSPCFTSWQGDFTDFGNPETFTEGPPRLIQCYEGPKPVLALLLSQEYAVRMTEAVVVGREYRRLQEQTNHELQDLRATQQLIQEKIAKLQLNKDELVTRIQETSAAGSDSCRSELAAIDRELDMEAEALMLFNIDIINAENEISTAEAEFHKCLRGVNYLYGSLLVDAELLPDEAHLTRVDDLVYPKDNHIRQREESIVNATPIHSDQSQAPPKEDTNSLKPEDEALKQYCLNCGTRILDQQEFFDVHQKICGGERVETEESLPEMPNIHTAPQPEQSVGKKMEDSAPRSFDGETAPAKLTSASPPILPPHQNECDGHCISQPPGAVIEPDAPQELPHSVGISELRTALCATDLPLPSPVSNSPSTGSLPAPCCPTTGKRHRDEFDEEEDALPPIKRRSLHGAPKVSARALQEHSTSRRVSEEEESHHAAEETFSSPVPLPSVGVYESQSLVAPARSRSNRKLIDGWSIDMRDGYLLDWATSPGGIGDSRI